MKTITWTALTITTNHATDNTDINEYYNQLIFKKGRVFFCVFRGPGAVKQKKPSRNTETNSKINSIFATSYQKLTPSGPRAAYLKWHGSEGTSPRGGRARKGESSLREEGAHEGAASEAVASC